MIPYSMKFPKMFWGSLSLQNAAKNCNEEAWAEITWVNCFILNYYWIKK
jgi:hypothetical protein